MIKLDASYVISSSVVLGGQVVNTTTMDTFYLTQFAADFVLGTLYATIQRGTITDGVFVANLPPFVVTVNPDGSFVTADGSYKGVIPNIAAFTTGMKLQLDQFILSSDLVTGTID